MTFVTVVVTESGDATARHSRSPRKALPPPPTISPPTNTALVGVVKEEEKDDGTTALLYDLVDELMVVKDNRYESLLEAEGTSESIILPPQERH